VKVHCDEDPVPVSSVKGGISVAKRKHVCEIGPPKIGIRDIREIHLQTIK